MIRMQRWIMHIDMDAFYASVEQLDNPMLRGLPVIVGGNSARGVVSTASYEARKFGVRSAMPMFRARVLCPEGVFVRGNRERYSEVSQQVMTVLHSFSPLVQQASIDEAYLDATGLERLFGQVENLGQEVKAAVHGATGLSCSVGLAPVKFLAKIASGMNKPNGLTVIYPERVPAFLREMPIGRIPGVGQKTLPALQALGVRFAADVTRYPKDFWARRFGKMGEMLYARGQGIDPREVVPYEPPKSESAENTFEEDTLDRDILYAWLLRQSEQVGQSLRRLDFKGRTVTLKVKYADFTGVTRARTLPRATNVTRTIFETAVELFEELAPRMKLRLIGVGVSHFGDDSPQVKTERAVQLSLLEEKPLAGRSETQVELERETALDAAVDAVRNRFGKNALVRGRLFSQEEAAQDDCIPDDNGEGGA